MTNQERANHGAKEVHQDRRIAHQARQVARREAKKKAKEQELWKKEAGANRVAAEFVAISRGIPRAR